MSQEVDELRALVMGLYSELHERWSSELAQGTPNWIVNGTLTETLDPGGVSTMLREDNGAPQEIEETGFVGAENGTWPVGSRVRVARIGKKYEVITITCPADL